MRVIAGSARGRPLTAPPGRSTRPTSDRVREALFSSVAELVPGAVVLDLYAGSGAMGIEALSRNAQFAVFVEEDRRAAQVIRVNLAAAKVQARARVIQGDVGRFCAAPPPGVLPAPASLVLCDPPYAEPLPRVLGHVEALCTGGHVAEGATVVIERGRRDPHLEDEPPRLLVRDRLRPYGDTVLFFLRYAEARS